MTAENEIKRCAIYTRKSTEEGLDMEYNSLEAQFDACAAYIHSQAGKNWRLVDRRYDDGGYSGGTMDRPALQMLLQDVRAGKIDVVVVYKMDRISRSMPDFTALSTMLSDRNVSLVSVTQQIDTSSSMGRMFVNMLMSFAQYEREMTADRIRDKLAASRKKGMWTGGIVPYGYKSVERKLVVDPETAPKVLFAFQRYAHNHSFLQTMRDLREAYGKRTASSEWSVMNVRSMLTQAIPAGKIRDGKSGELFDGQHEPIVPYDLWLKVQQYVADARKGKRESRSEHIAPLKGVIRCGYCDCAMVPTYCTNRGKRTFHYYRCDKTHKHQSENCRLKNISAAAIEGPVFDLIGRLITNEYFLQLVAADDDQLERLRRLGADKAKFIGMMTNIERHRLVQLFIKSIAVRRDGLEIIVHGDGFKKLMGKGE